MSSTPNNVIKTKHVINTEGAEASGLQVFIGAQRAASFKVSMPYCWPTDWDNCFFAITVSRRIAAQGYV